MVFVDASAYLAILNSEDTNHTPALGLAERYKNERHLTSQAVLGEVLTVGSQRYTRQTTIEFVQRILDSETVIVLEDQSLVERGFEIFGQITNKNISWVDCYSSAIMEKYEIDTAFTFDKDFRKAKSTSGKL